MNREPIHVLLIDDDKDSLLLTQGHLSLIEDAEYQLQWADTFDEGIAALLEGEFDVCLLDYRLGARDGLELLRRVQIAGCRVPIIMLTGQGERSVDVEAAAAGAADYLVKASLDASRLERSIRYAVERQRLLDALEKRAEQLKRSQIEIRKAKDAAESAYRNLRETESQLIHTEKMAAIGQLVAGLAHEINNPATFVLNNIHCIARDLEDIDAYQRVCDQLCKTVLKQDVSEKDLKSQSKSVIATPIRETVEEMRSLIVAAQSGMTRIRDLVARLRSYSRIDAIGEFGPADLREGIYNSLMLVRPIVPEKVRIVTDFDELPSVVCNGGQINQVITNLLTNALHAVGEEGQIRIMARAEQGGVTISVEDDGRGIPDDIRGRVFDPFFTTKEVGQGTGLGLSISRRIVDAHRGRMDFHSQEDKGTVFHIWLPLTQERRDAEAKLNAAKT